MKKYLVEISIFLLLTLTMCLGFSKINNYIVHRALKKNSKEVTTLILGDSHARWLNEEILPKSMNLFQGGDTFKASYHKLRKMTEVAPNLDTVIIAFDYHNIGPLYTRKIDKHKESTKRISHLASVPEVISSTSNYPKLVEVLFQQKFSFNFRAISNEKSKFNFDDNTKYHRKAHYAINHENSIKNNKNYKYNKSQDSIAYQNKVKSTRWFYFKEGEGPLGLLTLDYLDKMLALCKQKGIKCYFISMPLDPELKAQIPKNFIQKFDELIIHYKTEFDIPHYDFRSEFDQKLELLENPDHCTPYGGALISEKLLTLMRTQS